MWNSEDSSHRSVLSLYQVDLRIKSRSSFLLANARAHYAILPVPSLFKKKTSKQINERREERKNKRKGGREGEGRGKSLKKIKTRYLSLCMCTNCVQVPTENERGHQIPWHWKYRSLSAPMWLLGSNCGPLSRSILFFLISLIAFFYFLSMCLWAQESPSACGGQTTTVRRSTAQAQTQVSSIGTRHIYHLSHLSRFQCYSFSLVVVVMVCTCCTTVCTGVHACASICWSQRSMLETFLYYSLAVCVRVCPLTG